MRFTVATEVDASPAVRRSQIRMEPSREAVERRSVEHGEWVSKRGRGGESAVDELGLNGSQATFLMVQVCPTRFPTHVCASTSQSLTV